MKELKKIKKIATLAAKDAGAELLKRYYKFSRKDLLEKPHNESLTKADLAADKIISDLIKKNFPTHRILSEESGDNSKKSDYMWIVDPLDGTTNFSMHNPIWAVSIGVAFRGKIIFGVVFAPFLDELYTAEIGEGAKLNNKKISVSTKNTGKILNTFCHGHLPREIKRAVSYYQKQKSNGVDCRQMGSASIELAYTAVGRIESIVIPGANAWDVAAGVLLVQEAGGRVTDKNNKKWSLGSEDMVASNRKVHRQILEALN